MVSFSRPKTGLVVLSAALALGMSACSSSSNSSNPRPTATVMVTVKHTTTPTASATSTESPESSATTESSPTTTPSPTTSSSPTSAPTPTTPKGPPPTPGGGFDASWAKQAVSIILGDIKTIDGLSQSDSALGNDYSNLSNAYGYLEQAGVPKGADGNAYLGGLETMIGLAFDASTAVSTDPAGAHAKYESARQKTQPVLDDINAALGTHYAVPAAPAT